MKTIIFSCSERQDNLSIKASKAVSQYFDNVEVIDLRDYHLNTIGTTDEATNKHLAQITQKFTEAKQVIFLSPEYNWSLSPSAKNLIDYLSFNRDIWNGKIFMCFGCSAGRGGRLPIIELWTILNKVIAFSNAQSIISPYHIEITANLLDENDNFVASFQSVAAAVFENHKKLVSKISL